jgi:hypothetical protein
MWFRQMVQRSDVRDVLNRPSLWGELHELHNDRTDVQCGRVRVPCLDQVLHERLRVGIAATDRVL